MIQKYIYQCGDGDIKNLINGRLFFVLQMLFDRNILFFKYETFRSQIETKRPLMFSQIRWIQPQNYSILSFHFDQKNNVLSFKTCAKNFTKRVFLYRLEDGDRFPWRFSRLWLWKVYKCWQKWQNICSVPAWFSPGKFNVHLHKNYVIWDDIVGAAGMCALTEC